MTEEWNGAERKRKSEPSAVAARREKRARSLFFNRSAKQWTRDKGFAAQETRRKEVALKLRSRGGGQEAVAREQHHHQRQADRDLASHVTILSSPRSAFPALRHKTRAEKTDPRLLIGRSGKACAPGD